jgi:hypothetical protein
LLQRLGVIGIVLILIYSLYQKNLEITSNPLLPENEIMEHRYPDLYEY